jgi:hypothetical protein
MSDEATIRAAIKTAVQTVANVGLVYDYQRLTTEWDAFLDLFKTSIGDSDVIRGWCITCEGMVPQERETYGGNTSNYARNYPYKIRGYFGVDDSAESEKTAFIIAELVVDALTDHISSAALDNIPALSTFEPRVFGGTLCHFAEISMTVLDEYIGS